MRSERGAGMGVLMTSDENVMSDELTVELTSEDVEDDPEADRLRG